MKNSNEKSEVKDNGFVPFIFILVLAFLGLYLTVYSSFVNRHAKIREDNARRTAVYIENDSRFNDAIQAVYGFDEQNIAEVR